MFAPKIRRAARALLVAALASLASLASADGQEERARSSAEHGVTKDATHGAREDESGHVTRAELQRVQQALLEELGRNGDRAVAEPEFTDRG